MHHPPPPCCCWLLLLQVVFPDHVPEDVHEQPINIDLTPVVKVSIYDGGRKLSILGVLNIFTNINIYICVCVCVCVCWLSPSVNQVFCRSLSHPSRVGRQSVCLYKTSGVVSPSQQPFSRPPPPPPTHTQNHRARRATAACWWTRPTRRTSPTKKKGGKGGRGVRLCLCLG